MSDWFKNPSSEIPDEMWKAPAPMQRQADAVVLWAELTGKHASGCGNHGAKPKKAAKKIVKKASAIPPTLDRALMAAGRNPELTGAGIGSLVGAGRSLSDYRTRESGISSAEAKLIGEIASAQAQKAEQDEIAALREALALAKYRRENLGGTIAKGTTIGAGLGALSGLTQRQVRKYMKGSS